MPCQARAVYERYGLAFVHCGSMCWQTERRASEGDSASGQQRESRAGPAMSAVFPAPAFRYRLSRTGLRGQAAERGVGVRPLRDGLGLRKLRQRTLQVLRAGVPGGIRLAACSCRWPARRRLQLRQWPFCPSSRVQRLRMLIRTQSATHCELPVGAAIYTRSRQPPVVASGFGLDGGSCRGTNALVPLRPNPTPYGM